MNEIVEFVKGVIEALDPVTLLALTGVVTFGVQELLNRYKHLREATNKLVSFVLPVAGAVLATLVEPASLLVAYPAVFTVAQAAYRTYKVVMVGVEWLKLGKAVSGYTPLPETGHTSESYGAATQKTPSDLF